MAAEKPIDWQIWLPEACLSAGTGPNAVGSLHEDAPLILTILGGMLDSDFPGNEEQAERKLRTRNCSSKSFFIGPNER